MMKYAMMKKNRETTREEAFQIVDACEYATIATVDEDGMPYCVPISIVLKDEKYLYIHGMGRGHRMENIKRDNRVCVSGVSNTALCPAKYTTDFSSFVIFGKAVVVDSQEEKVDAMKLIVQKYAPDFMHRFDEVMTRMMKATFVVRIEIEDITGKKKDEGCEPK